MHLPRLSFLNRIALVLLLLLLLERLHACVLVEDKLGSAHLSKVLSGRGCSIRISSSI